VIKMADNSTPETSAQNSFSFNDAVTSLIDPPEAENQEEVAAESQEELEAQPSEEEEVEAEVEGEVDETEPDVDEEADFDAEEDALDEDDQEDDQETPDTYTVKVDGENVEVTLEEALAGYQRQGAFTKRMQELSEGRKALEAEASVVRQNRDKYAQGLELLSNHLQSVQAQEPDWDRLYNELDAKEYARAVQLHNERKNDLAAVEAERGEIHRQQAAENQAAFQQHLVTEKQRLLDVIPAWQDETRMKKERAAVVNYAKTLGYTAEEIQVASDHRAVKALYDSWRLSTLNKETDVAKKKVRKAPKMAKAGTPRPKGESQTRRKKQLSQRLNKERSVNAAVDLLLG
tara:strand:+ start:1211 stop:2248 length:1038 start_codon:yes stop_codon:yes gene_type:complete